MSLGEIKERLENAIGVSIKLPQPYKLCDYKPAYGLIFDDIVSKYDYWGWCDPDIIFGDLSLIFNKETLNEFDVIGGAGSMTIFKNTDFLKRCFLYTNPSIPSFSFDEIRCTSQSMIFDEWGAVNIRKVLKIKETSQYDWLFKKIVDIIPPDKRYRHSNMYIRFCENPIAVEYQDGHIFAHIIQKNGIEKSKEYAYCHLQKRKMCILTQDTDHFLIFNELFLPASIICGKDINNNALYTQQFYTPEQHETIKTNKINKTVSIILKLISKPKRPLFIRLMRKIGIYHKYLITK